MTQHPAHRDDLTEARAADRLNAWLDGTDSSPAAEPGLIARAVDRVAQSGLPDDAIRRHEDTLWESLMHQHTTPAALPMTTLPLAASSRPTIADPRPLRRTESRIMGLVATLTLVLLVGLSAVAVYLSSPQSGDEPTMTLAAIGGASPAATPPAAEPTPVRPDSTAITTRTDVPPLWALPPVSAYDLPTLDTLGAGWSPLAGSHYLWVLDGTSVQAEVHTYVDNQGNRVRTIVAYFPENGSIEEARGWAEREIAIYQESLIPHGGAPAEEAASRQIEGCAETYRAEGREPITSYFTFATACFSEDRRTMVLVAVSGNVFLPGTQPFLNPADGLVATILEATTSAATPVAGT
ncbi:MAG TPA: hypothetical protein VGT61_16570 [Thermomicrobiales bacterium]|jgi:hypothetical protein|nr:hypothetical protein [Thermomicrobiales bacterium]